MKNNVMLIAICLVLFISYQQIYSQDNANAQKNRLKENSSTDINKKADELGITTKQLESILNSVSGQQGENDPQPDAMQQRFFTGQSAGEGFGYSVSTAGDVNGDGYSDVIVGAVFNSIGGTNTGRAYIYFGGPGLDIIPDVILTGAAANDKFGNSVSTAGDVNGDGY